MARIVGRLLLGGCVALLALAVLLVVAGRSGAATFRGARALTVLSGSMEPSLHVGSIVIVRAIDPASARVGDVITFRTPAMTGRRVEETLTTHRIEAVSTIAGRTAFKTKGDANGAADPWEVPAADVVGMPVFAIPWLGYLGDIARSRIGFVVLVVVPGALLILMEIASIVAEVRRTRARDPEGQVRIG